MVTPARLDIKAHNFTKEDRLLLDANIWLSVYGPIAMKNWRTGVYSEALKQIQTNGSQVCLDVLVLSEFINSFARLEYNQLSPETKPKDFKTFRYSGAFKPVAQEIAINARKMTRISQKCDSEFCSIDVEVLLADFEQGQSDFNDQVLCELCRRKGLTLVTHDADFAGQNIPILTANSRLLV